ncbi:hypothetical protein J4E85_003819 [Alternaria conjuncta]|uniref:uncharacterized protein n=1 Tax=Alternaria conjuncta TaxID=181017 RepID=UPI00221F5414|nr:uncharacterized protein J4E85_003819 [Alternaria conjuncta]KAI4931229.1 hypothetical protein J4E85_003819 [Alternaria conjuncta]
MVTTRARKKAVLAQEEAEVARKLLLPFRLLDLPAEIIGNISDHLDDKDLINVRRVCRALSAHVAHAFGQRFFRHLIVILHPTSLTTLFEISRHKTLSKYVHRVTVSGQRIGHTLFTTVNETAHNDLQASVERSRMDLLILTEALRELKSLQNVRVDRSSFRCDAGWTQNIKIKCGRGLMFNKDSVTWNGDTSEHQNFNRVYELTLQALVQAQMDEKVELDLQFVNPNEGRNTFNCLVDSESWREGLCKRLRYFSTVGDMDLDWLGRLLSLSTGITKLKLRQNRRKLNLLLLAREPGGAFSFPGLRHLNITRAVLHYETWLVFLRLHAAVLEEVVLHSVGLQNGTWHQALATLETMPRLNNLSLDGLLEQMPYQNASTDPLDWNPGHLSLRSQAAIKAALSVMRAEPKTVAVDWVWMRPLDGPNGEVYYHAVDCRGYTAIANSGSWDF